MSGNLLDIETVLNDLNDMRARPETLVSRFKTVLFSFKGFGKQTDQLSLYIEDLIEKLPRMKKLSELKPATELDLVAQALLEEYEKNKTNISNLSRRDLDNFVKPYIKKFGKISVICEEQRQASLLLNKILLKKDDDKNLYGEKNSNHLKLFDPQIKYVGISVQKIERISFYVIVFVDEFEKVKKFNPDLVSPQELSEYRELFDLFDEDRDGLIIPKDFNEQLESIGVAKIMPCILKFAKYFNDPKFRRGVDFDGFVEAIVEFGSLDDEEGIRRIFELYIDDVDQYTITLAGMKRIVKELNSSVLQDQIHDLFKYAINKDVDLTFQEFRDHILRGIQEGRIKIPKRI